ncbi:P1 family peptidase [Salinibacillus xinjiangensis]|uniref:Peptidase S58 family protein n=1 Tax=Salinibacillus xinjiangensis TaxID=1229268 RepID=A0A6G1X4E8_9BACI|nr:P1 family peptidase [Salinibacillus xinjiangensis]MRG85799.1 peptidase S58 family protein [Salinibacillus xinjiangensis]
MREIPFQQIDGFRLGHAQDEKAATGCSVIICEEGAVGGVDVRGGSPGTRETDLLDPKNLVEDVHAVFLSGGSAYGLNVGGGIMQFLEEKQIGFDVQVAKVPIVSGAILFDLFPGNPTVRPDHQMGYQACEGAYQNEPLQNGNVGAGTGATVGKCLGPEFAMKGGLGTYAVQIGDLQIGAVVAVNCFGDVIDPKTGGIIAGVYDQKHQSFLSSEQQLLSQSDQTEKTNRFKGNTTIGTIVTNAKLNKGQASKISSMAHDGLARTMRPSHALVDGDTIFTMSTNKVEAELNVVGMLATTVMEKAIIKAVREARTSHGILAYNDLRD